MKDFYTPRSDIAAECRDIYIGSRGDLDGIESEEKEINGIKIEKVTVKTPAGAAKLGKNMGSYITLSCTDITKLDAESFDALCDLCADELSRLIPRGSCLLACLGNRKITADAQGPLCAEEFIVTRHIKEHSPEIFQMLDLRESTCIVPNVLGNTGIEAAKIVKSVAEKIKPDFVIAVDSLCAGSTSRLASTVQISDGGISPGSGIGNHRMALSRETLGVPVIAMGIPTVLDAHTIVIDAVRGAGAEGESAKIIIDSLLEKSPKSFFVTPKDADKVSAYSARLLARSINKALNPDLSYEEMAQLVGI